LRGLSEVFLLPDQKPERDPLYGDSTMVKRRIQQPETEYLKGDATNCGEAGQKHCSHVVDIVEVELPLKQLITTCSAARLTKMSQGQPDHTRGLVPLRPNQIVSTDEYAANQRKIAQIRQLAASLEQSNDQAHQRYVQQELQRRVEEGERARLVLFLLAAADDCLTLF
jgi:hypothetical protein